MTIQQSSLSDTQYESLCSLFLKKPSNQILFCQVVPAVSTSACVVTTHVCLPSTLIVSQIKPVEWQNELINSDVRNIFKQ